MACVTVQVAGRSYPVLIGEGVLTELPRIVRDLDASGIALVTDRGVGPLWTGAVVDALRCADVTCPVQEVEEREEAKTLAVLERVLTFLEDARIDRRGVVIALGGGTVGDLAGFAAAAWMRGVRYVQVPTTLLAMVDASVGGKTAVNAARTKNAIGAFWQPAAVIADLAMLGTLPDGELASGMAEVIKYGLSLDAGLARCLEAEQTRLRARDHALLEPIVARCVELKAAVVAADEREQGGRAILNYGHTVGHAIEAASGYRAVHGRAVAQGMRVAVRIGAAMGLCEEPLVGVHDRLLAAYELPGPLPDVSADAILEALPRDKKAAAGRIGWVLPRALGQAQIDMAVPPDLVASVVRGVVRR